MQGATAWNLAEAAEEMGAVGLPRCVGIDARDALSGGDVSVPVAEALPLYRLLAA